MLKPESIIPAAIIQMTNLMARVASLSGMNSALAPGEVMADLDEEARVRYRQRHGAVRMGSAALKYAVEWFGPNACAPLFEWSFHSDFEDALDEKRGVILVGWHAGVSALHASFCLDREFDLNLGHIVGPNALRNRSRLHWQVSENAVENGITISQAINHLKDGGSVMQYLDGQQGRETCPAVINRKRVQLRRGPATLARLSGTPIHPVLATWNEKSGRPVLNVGPAIHSTSQPTSPVSSEPLCDYSSDAKTIQEMAGWYSRAFRCAPEVVRRENFRKYLSGHVCSS